MPAEVSFSALSTEHEAVRKRLVLAGADPVVLSEYDQFWFRWVDKVGDLYERLYIERQRHFDELEAIAAHHPDWQDLDDFIANESPRLVSPPQSEEAKP